MKNAKPNAMWISVEQADYDSVAVGDHVSINFPNGGGMIDLPKLITDLAIFIKRGANINELYKSTNRITSKCYP